MSATSSNKTTRAVSGRQKSAGRALQTCRPMSQAECDAKGYGLGLAYGMGAKKRRAHVTRTKSRRIGRRASWLRDAAVLLYTQGDPAEHPLRSLVKVTTYGPALFR